MGIPEVEAAAISGHLSLPASIAGHISLCCVSAVPSGCLSCFFFLLNISLSFFFLDP